MAAPPNRSRPRPPQRPASPPPGNLPRLSERELDELQTLLDAVPAPLEALDVSMLDGFLCGLLVQPRAVPVARWLPHITDADGRPLPARFDPSRLHTLALRRHAELNDAIARRQWFDPWVFELSDDDEAAAGHEAQEEHAEHEDADEDDDDGDFGDVGTDAVYPWVAGFATAMELFPELMRADADKLTEPLALLYRHLAPDDLEDADELLAEIDSLEPPADLTEAVEGLVRATLLLADVGRPLASPTAPSRPGSSSRTSRPPQRPRR